jgi:hypothetical protein
MTYLDLKKLNFTHLPNAKFTANLGDDIQTACAIKLWGVSRFVERDNFKEWASDMIIPFFGWYGYDYSSIPEAKCILVSFHFCNKMKKHIIDNTKTKDWLLSCVKEQGFPALARDTSTMRFMQQLGIDCEFGGCITQTLKPYAGERSKTLSIEAPPHIEKNCDIALSQYSETYRNLSHQARIKLAMDRIDLFAQCKHVHTSRLHTYLPCKALGTDVTFYNYKIFEPHRLSGLIPNFK